MPQQMPLRLMIGAVEKKACLAGAVPHSNLYSIGALPSASTVLPEGRGSQAGMPDPRPDDDTIPVIRLPDLGP